MADKSIEQLNSAEKIYATDLLVLQQSGQAKKLTGQVLENWLVSLADGHGGIQSIVKVGTSGLVDTYRITLADTTTVDFTVTNGRAISEIRQTSVSGLTRTYRISFNDGTSESFSVTDGRSITGFKKTGTSGLTDTYTLTYNDGTTGEISVTNGRGITGVSKTGTSGLVDTYKITYNDGTTDTFTVTNGAKGDKGDNTYTWIKYASQEPTESSHSMGDIPDDWRGEYNGPLSSPPTDWKQYKWYKIKGDKGDTGDAATLVNKSVTYQVGDSGSIVPSGAWSSSVPVVPQGKYLWTKTEVRFNTGDPIVSYISARQGIDGSGSVSSVNDVSPDDTGNVTLTASDVEALPTAGGDMTGEIRMNGQPISGLNAPTEDTQAANKGYVDERIVNIFGTNEAWNSNKSYAVGDICIYNNALWKCVVDNSGQKPTNGTYWKNVSLVSNDNIMVKNYSTPDFNFMSFGNFYQMDIPQNPEGYHLVGCLAFGTNGGYFGSNIGNSIRISGFSWNGSTIEPAGSGYTFVVNLIYVKI